MLLPCECVTRMEFITTTVTILLLGIPAFWIGIQLAQWILLVIHEAGHAVAAWFLGLEIAEIRLGFGRRIFERRFGRLGVRIARYPICGWVMAFPTVATGFRMQWCLFVLGGPLASALAYAALFVIGPEKAWYFEWSWSWVLYAFGRTVRYMSLWTLIVTVFPRRCRLYGQCALTDGLQLWMLFFLGRSGAARVFANLQGHRARLLWARGKRDEATVILREAQVSAGLESDLATCAHIAVFHAEQGRVDEAMRTLRELLTETARDKEVHAAVADAFCLVVIHGNLVGELPEAEQIIRKAIARCPDEILLNVSLGGILYEQGRYVDALKALKALDDAGQEPLPLGAAIRAACFARLSQRGDDIDAAWRRAQEAKSACPGHPLVKRLLAGLAVDVRLSS